MLDLVDHVLKCDGCGCWMPLPPGDPLPEGWTRFVAGARTTHWDGHRCPACGEEDE